MLPARTAPTRRPTTKLFPPPFTEWLRFILFRERSPKMKQGPKPDLQSPTLAVPKDMSSREIDQFLTCARMGRLGMILPEGEPYIVPVGYGYGEGKIYFHTCSEGL